MNQNRMIAKDAPRANVKTPAVDMFAPKMQHVQWIHKQMNWKEQTLLQFADKVIEFKY